MAALRRPERRSWRHRRAPTRRAVAVVTAGLAAMEGGGRPSAAQAVLLAASTAITALLYSIYRQKARVARGLEVGVRSAAGECMCPAPEPRPGRAG